MFWPSFPVARGNRWLADTLERVIQRKSDWNIQFLITSQKVNAFLIQHWNSFHVQGSKFNRLSDFLELYIAISNVVNMY